jgi:beta-glucosidase
MSGYEAIDGVPAVANAWLLREVLRVEWNWPGLVVTDWNDVGQLIGGQHVAKDMDEAAELAVKAGNDMMMNTPGFYQGAMNALKSGKLDISVVDEAVKRCLYVKFKMGLFEDPRHPDHDKAVARASSTYSREQALKLCEKSLVLLKNDHDVLPFNLSTVKKFAVIGPNADDAAAQNGDWAHAQPREHAVTVLDGIKEIFKGELKYEKGCGIEPGEKGDQEAAVAALKWSDAAVVVIGDRLRYYGESKSTATLSLQGGQIDLLNALVATGKKFALVVISSKPLVIPQNIRDKAAAVIWQFCPGQLGGRALARAVFGKVNPSGKLAISIPAHVGQLPVFYYKFRYWHGGYADSSMAPAWAFGQGLSYSGVDYLRAYLDKEVYIMGEDITVTVWLRNYGNYDVDEIVQIYVQDELTSVTWVEQQLKQFVHVHMKPLDTNAVGIKLNTRDLWLIDKDGRRVVEPGTFELRVSRSSIDHKFKLKFSIE